MIPTLIIGDGASSDRWAAPCTAPTAEPGSVLCSVCEAPVWPARTVLDLPVCDEHSPRPLALPTAGQRRLDARAPVYSAATAPRVSRARVAGLVCTVVEDGDTRTMIPRRMGRAAAVRAARSL